MRTSLEIILLLLATLPYSGVGAPATVSTFTGGDPGEGLDLQGYFTYAVNVGPDGAAGKVGDANFTADTIAGVTVDANKSVAKGGWGAVKYGDTGNDKNLSFVMNSIRSGVAPVVVTVTLAVEKGVEYKLQILEHEDCCPGRGFNIVVDGVTEVANLRPGRLQQGDTYPADPNFSGNFLGTKNSMGVVVAKQFVATSNTLVFVCDGPAANDPNVPVTDHNAILAGFTLERITASLDNDGDGLPDDWEVKYFQNLNQGANGDPDQDGLTNQEELAAGTNPNVADTDGDGLKDGEEIKTYHTEPLKMDTDDDGLNDGLEVNTHHTDPINTDTDGDGVADGVEVAVGLNPLVADRPALTSLGIVKGGDKGEGLDLDGTFVYALAIGAPDGTDVKVRDAEFLALSVDEVPGASLVAGNRIENWVSPLDYGDSPDDDNLEIVTSSIRFSDYTSRTPAVILTLDNLEVGAEYKVQIIAGEQCCNRGYHVYFDDKPVVKDFNPGKLQGRIAQGHQTALITQIYIARSTQLVIRLDGRGASNAKSSDHNPILNAVTVKKIAEAADTDHDGLPDEWEKFFFGNLNQTANGDLDGDGLTHAQEYVLGSDPLAEEPTRDSDGDGLFDSDEVKIYQTDPAKADSDGDDLSDGYEVKTSHTDPFKADTDGDGMPDGLEVTSGTDPLVAEPKTVFSNVIVAAFTGGDPGEGLDLQGNFVYAGNLSSAGPAGKAGDATFARDNAPGVRMSSPSILVAWDTPEYGDSDADNVIEKVTSSIRYGPVVKMQLANLVPGSTYKLQLLFYEQCCGNRGFNVYADANLIAENFNPSVIQGGVNNTAAGAVVSAEFTTQRDHLVVVLTPKGVTDDTLTDPNAILDGFTLEALSVVAPPKEPNITGVVRDASGFSVTFASEIGRSYTLEYRASLSADAWSPASNTVSATGVSTTLTDTNTQRLAAPAAFYRVRAQ